MLDNFRTAVFSLYEHRVLRNWFYTVAFAIFVPVGLRFALLAWEFGGHLDKFLAVVGGIAVGVTAIVTLMRIWSVPPRKTVAPVIPLHHHQLHPYVHPTASEMAAAAKVRSARNRLLARDARALGSPRIMPR